MKKFLIFIGIVFVYIPLHFVISSNVEFYRSKIPDFAVSQIVSSCIANSGNWNTRQRQLKKAVEFACRCIANEVQARYYLEEYILLSAKIIYDRAQGGDGDQNRLAGAKLQTISDVCLSETIEKFSDQ